MHTAVRDTNPFAGVSFHPYSEAGCSGSGQGNTNVDIGTTACVNVSNAKSFDLVEDLCDSATIDYYGEFDCGGDVLFTHTLGAAVCYAKTDTAVLSMRVRPEGCP